MSKLLQISLGRTRESHDVKNVDMTWGELVAMMGSPVVDQHLTQADYQRLTVDQQLAAKDKGYYVTGHFKRSRRSKANIEFRNPGVADIDHGPPDALDRIIESMAEFKYVVTSTRKDTVQKPRLRIAWLFDRPVNSVEYSAVCRRLASWIANDSIEWFDHTGFQFSRVMFRPSTSRDQDFVFWENRSGVPVPVDEILATYTDYRDVSEWPVSKLYEDKIREEGKKIGNPLTKPGVIGAFNRMYDILGAIERFIPGVYVAGSTPDRLTYSAGSSSNGAVIYDDGVALYSNHETDPTFGSCVNAFDLVRIHLFGKLDEKAAKGTPVNLLPSFDRMQKFAHEDTEVSEEFNASRIADRSEAFINYIVEDADVRHYDTPSVATNEETPAPVGYVETRAEIEVARTSRPEPKDVTPNKAPPTDAEKTRLVVSKLKTNERGAIVATLTNAENIVALDPMFENSLCFNVFARSMMLMKKIPGVTTPIGLNGELWDDGYEVQMRSLIERKYGVSLGREMMHDAASLVASKRRYHPVKEILENLPEWDGVERLDTFFIDHYGAKDDEYMRTITRKWFVAAVARIYKPGEKFDHMIVLEGKEGKLKSLVFSILFYGLFTDGLVFGLQQKEVIEATQGYWCCEISEMVSRSVATNEANKAFISRVKETARMSYGRNPSERRRQFVMMGSTNEEGYLNSLTGNRRFWPVKGDGRAFDAQTMYEIRDQLWAEVLTHYYNGETLYLKGDRVVALAMAEQEQRTARDDWHDRIANWLDEEIPLNYWESTDRARSGDFDKPTETMLRDKVSAGEIWEVCLQEPIGRFRKQEQIRVAGIMNAMPGWKRSTGLRFGIRYGRGRGWFRETKL